MHRILAITENTFKQGLRQRILVLLIIFAILIIVVSVFFGPFVLGEIPKILRDIGLATISFFGVLAVIIIGSSLIYRDIRKRTIYTIITKPVKRSEIIIGKFLGLVFIIAVLICGMVIIHQLIIFIYEGFFDTFLLIALPFIIIELMILSGVLILFSSSSSTTISAVMGSIFFIVGHAAPELKIFADNMDTPVAKYLTYAFYYILPNLEHFNFRLELVHKLPLHSGQILFSICYGLIYVILLLYISIILFEKREFK
jgi:ABC-type transport system involved in multi-copper enzyme maturation permease subunit